MMTVLNQELSLKEVVRMNRRIPHDTTKLFCDIWDNAADFLADWKDSGLYAQGLVKDDNIKTLFYLLYARHANSAIANWDQEQFKYKVYANIFQYGPTWEKRLDVQTKLRALTDEELMQGSKAIMNHAYNPSQAPGTGTLTELDYINEQNTNNYKKSKVEGYALLLDLLETDVTAEFLNRFKPLFATFVYTRPDLFVTELDEEEEDDEQ